EREPEVELAPVVHERRRAAQVEWQALVVQAHTVKPRRVAECRRTLRGERLAGVKRREHARRPDDSDEAHVSRRSHCRRERHGERTLPCTCTGAPEPQSRTASRDGGAGDEREWTANAEEV